jgi:hypothetical protein
LSGGSVNVETMIDASYWEKAQRDIIRRKQERISQYFLDIYKQVSENKKFVIFCDDFCWIIDQKIGDWLLMLLEQMDNTVTLVSRTITEGNLKWKRSNMQALHLQPFSISEIQQYMHRRSLELTEDQLRKVYQYSHNGHPLLISLVADFLCRLDRRNEQDIDQYLDKLIGSQGRKLWGPVDLDELTASIDRIIEELRNDIRLYDPSLLLGLNVLGVARVVDRDLLKYTFVQMLAGDTHELTDEMLNAKAEASAYEFIKRMKQYSVVEELIVSDHTRYRLHYLVRERMEVALQKEKDASRKVENYHSWLASYYRDKENNYLKDQSEYSRMFRLENPEWQHGAIEWLYHLSRLGKRENARLQLTRVFMEAFDWWGWLVAFGFCEELLESWEQTQPDEDADFIRLLRDFQNAYPLGYVKLGSGDWSAVNKSLIAIRSNLRLTKTPAEQMSPDQRIVRGHIDRYIAESFRFYQKPNYSKAEQHYRSSLDYFEGNWQRAWVRSYLADLYLDWGQALAAGNNLADYGEKHKMALIEVGASNRLVMADAPDLDYELLSFNDRISGDLFVEQDMLNQAILSYNLAIVHAYIFYFGEDNMDEYSSQLYGSTADYVVKQLFNLAGRNTLDVMQKTCRYFRDFWEQNTSFNYAEMILAPLTQGFSLPDVIANRQSDELRAYLFPVIPEVNQKGDLMEIGLAVAGEMAELVSDPDSNLEGITF